MLILGLGLPLGLACHELYTRPILSGASLRELTNFSLALIDALHALQQWFLSRQST